MATRDYGWNIALERSFELDEDMDNAYSYVIAGASDNSVKLPDSDGEAGGVGILWESNDSGENSRVILEGIVPFRCQAGTAIAKLAPLTCETDGTMRTALAGEPIYATAVHAVTSAETRGYCFLLPGGGNVEMPRASVANQSSLTEDAELTSLEVPAGARLESLTVVNTTSNAVTIKIGKTAGAQDVVAAVAAGTGAVTDLTLLLKVFSLTSAQSLFISSASWNSANLTLYAGFLQLT